MANFCTECGAALAGSKKFCTECGTPTGLEGSAQTDTPSEPATVTPSAPDAVITPSAPDAVITPSAPLELPSAPEQESTPGYEDADEYADDGDDEDADEDEDLSAYIPFAINAIAHAATHDGDMSGFWDQVGEFKAWQQQPRGPSLKIHLPEDFRLTGRDLRQAAEFEQLLARTGVIMGPAGVDAGNNRNLWDYYNGFWNIDEDDAFPIDVYFGHLLSTRSDALLVRSPLILRNPRPDPDAVLEEIASVFWEEIFNKAENRAPGWVLAPYGDSGPGFFGRFDRAYHPFRGLMISEGKLVRFMHGNRRAIATIARPAWAIEVWYIIDAPPGVRDDIFLEVTDIITAAQGLLRDEATRDENSLVVRGLPFVDLGADADGLLDMGFFSRIEEA